MRHSMRMRLETYGTIDLPRSAWRPRTVSASRGSSIRLERSVVTHRKPHSPTHRMNSAIDTIRKFRRDKLCGRSNQSTWRVDRSSCNNIPACRKVEGGTSTCDALDSFLVTPLASVLSESRRKITISNSHLLKIVIM